MDLQNTTNINVDFYDKKYILINAKQYDKNTRYLLVTCYNHGELFSVSSSRHSAYVRYKKSDDYSVFNFCEITKDGKVLVELTEQMLASSGICYADLVIVNRGQAEVNAETCEIVNIDNASVLSTMTFCINVYETAVENSNIESSYEYSAFNQSLENYWADFEDVMRTSKSYAVGNAGGMRPNEDVDNAKYYYEQTFEKANDASDSALSAENSAKNASDSASAAKTSEVNAGNSEANANTYMGKAEGYMNAAKVSETNAKTSETNAKTSEANAKTSETNTYISEQNAKTSETNASTSETNAKASETSALNNANIAKSYAVGGTGERDGEDTDNAQYYYELVKTVVDSATAPVATVDEVKIYLGI